MIEKFIKVKAHIMVAKWSIQVSDVSPEPYQTSPTECFAKLVNG